MGTLQLSGRNMSSWVGEFKTAAIGAFPEFQMLGTSFFMLLLSEMRCDNGACIVVALESCTHKVHSPNFNNLYET